MNFESESLAILIAALDGHNPGIMIAANHDGTTSVTATGSDEPSDLDLTVHDSLEYRAAPIVVKDLARAAVHITHATAQALGQDPRDVDLTTVAHHLRSTLRIIHETDIDDD